MFKVISRNTRKSCEICPKLTTNTVESRSGVFIVYVTYLTFLNVSIVDFEQVNVYQGVLSCANIITQILKMNRCFI